MRIAVIFPIILLVMGSLALPISAQDIDYESWDLPGEGAGILVVNPADGSLWTFLHQTRNLVALNTTDGSVLLDVPLTLHPTAMAFTPDGSKAFIVGEPLDDQIFDRGLVQAIDTSDGSVLGELELEGACNTVHVESAGTIYVACGMQYAYNGTVYKLKVSRESSGAISLDIESQVECGKIPWAIATYRGTLYVTDLELQWTAQSDGSMGPPYGAWVWAYDAFGLELDQKSWVGLNPCRLVVTSEGVLVACSGSKQIGDDYPEPTLCLIDGPGECESIYIGSAGASDIAVAPDGSWAAATLADWGPPAAGSAVSLIQSYAPGTFSDLKRWAYTGDIALVKMVNDEVTTERIQILDGSFLRALAISIDGDRIFVLEGEPERVLIIPVDNL